MSNQPVGEIPGIGIKTERLLKTNGIATVQQLASCEDHSLITTIPKLTTFIEAAKSFLKKNPTQESLPAEPKTVPVSHEVSTCVKRETDETALLLHSHSWFGLRAGIPATAENSTFMELIIWELCVEPTNRVSFICAWIDDEELCKQTYTPQFLLHYNPDLPILEVAMQPAAYQTFVQREALIHTLYEIDVMQRVC